MAPCVIWHTPMRVKIAANLPHDLRNVVDADDAFVKDERVLPVPRERDRVGERESRDRERDRDEGGL